MVSVAMCDKSAIEKVAKLIGVRRTASGKAPITGRRVWRVQAIGTRALEVLDLVRPFLTVTRIEQAARAIEKARASGYRTRREIKELNKLKILKLVRFEPGSSTRRIRSRTGLDTAYVRRYLDELERMSKVRKITTRAGSEVWRRWFPVEAQEDSTSMPGSQADLNGEASEASAIVTSHMVTWSTPMPGGRMYESRLESPLDRAWLGGLTDAEGTVGTFRPKYSSHYVPRMAIRMLDKEAVDRAAALMGVTSVWAGISKGSRKQFWQANAVGGRAIRILDIIGPYLTPPKTAQAESAINKARKSGFRTIREMQVARKETILEYVKRNPGSLTTKIVNGARVTSKNARKVLAELEHQGKVRKVVGGTPDKPNGRWYPVENAS
jgi:predicted transcriptional regulator